MKVLFIEPGASWSVSDVADGVRVGLEAQGIDVIRYRLDQRLTRAASWLRFNWHRAKKTNPAMTKPTAADICYQAGVGAIEMALRHAVDHVLIVTAMFFHPDVIIMLKRAGLRTTVLFTETPYDLPHEIRVAELVDGCWTSERTAVTAFAHVTRARYLPHGWHPDRHDQQPQASDADVPAHDVVFVGSGFDERIALLGAIDWRGIDFGLYGSWTLPRRHPLKPFVRDGIIDNQRTAALYRRAHIGLNLYRSSGTPPQIPPESLNPRAYELARCGVFHLSTPRAEVGEIFGSLVPTFTTGPDAERLIRYWLARPDVRRDVAAQLPAKVADASWIERSRRIVADLRSLNAAA